MRVQQPRSRLHAVGGFAGAEHFVGDEGGVFVGGDAAVFLEPLFLVDAFFAGAFEELFAGFVCARDFVDLLNDALFDGVLNGDAVMGPAHGVTLVFDAGDDLVEDGVDAAVR